MRKPILPDTEKANKDSVQLSGVKGKRRKRRFRRMLSIFLILLVLGGSGLYAYARLKDEYTVTYDEYTATTGTISNSLSFSGTLALRDSASYSAASSATVRNVYVKPRDAVTKGQKLVRLSTGTTMTADFDGTVNVVNVQAGDEVAKDTLLVQIADFTHMQVSFRVDEYDIAYVAVGERCTVTATATERTFESQVETINYISQSTGNVAYYTGTAYVDVDAGVYPGMQVTVTVPQEEAVNVVVLKLDALSFTEANQACVYKMDETGALREETVEVGVSNGNYVEIKSGVTDGEIVYAKAKAQTANAMTSLFSGLFGSQQINRNSQRNNQRNNNTNRNWNGGSNGGTPGGTGGGR